MTLAPLTAGINLQEELQEQLNIEEIFGFDIGSVHIGFDESTVVSWIIMLVLTVLAVMLTRNLKVDGNISKRQMLLEMAYEKGTAFFKTMLGPKVEKYTEWLMSLAIFIGVSNMIGLFGMKPPTKSMQVTAAMALTSIVLVEYVAFKNYGVKKRLKKFTKPVAIVTPINVLEVFTKPLSLCMRLFGNIIAAFTIMELVKAVPFLKIGVPAVLSLYFDLFDGLLQAYIFCFLTAFYLEEAVEEFDDKPKKKKRKSKKNKEIEQTQAPAEAA